MRYRNIQRATAATMLLLALTTVAHPTEPPTGFPPVGDLLGLESEDGHGWMAIRVDFSEEYALSGILWYNNDGSVVFPAISVGTGYPEGPGLLDDAETVATGVSGASDGWSECTFDIPVAASLGGLYVILEFPAGHAFTERGAGGGPAVGFCDGLTEPAGWISGDGEEWHRLAGNFGFAMAPVLVPFSDGMLVKSMGGSDGADDAEIPESFYLSSGPNPFNPRIVIRFGLPRAGHASLVVYDIRGRRVARLLDEHLEAGHHTVAWPGRDGDGRQVASGVYFVRFQGAGETRVERVTLVK